MTADKTSGTPGRKSDRATADRPRIWTVGHSTHPLEEFMALLQRHGVGLVADVRTVPRSRHVPWFNQDSLSQSLPQAGVGYVHIKELGGLRHGRRDSPNTGWRNASFRAYADHMQTPEFAAGLERLEELACRQPVAVMCAEGVPWRCHRSLLSDALLARGWLVEEIMPDGSSRVHPLTPFARVEDGRIWYPPAGEGGEEADGGQGTLW